MCRRHKQDDFVRKYEARPVAAEGGLAVAVLLLLIRGYQYLLSPLFPPSCRYVPTCSEYTAQAMARYGVIQGIRLAVCRVLRCHPFAEGGYDPLK